VKKGRIAPSKRFCSGFSPPSKFVVAMAERNCVETCADAGEKEARKNLPLTVSCDDGNGVHSTNITGSLDRGKKEGGKAGSKWTKKRGSSARYKPKKGALLFAVWPTNLNGVWLPKARAKEVRWAGVFTLKGRHDSKARLRDTKEGDRRGSICGLVHCEMGRGQSLVRASSKRGPGTGF